MQFCSFKTLTKTTSKTVWKKEEILPTGVFTFMFSPVSLEIPHLLFTKQSLVLTFKTKPFENIVGKGENAGNQHFLLFSQCFLSYQRRIRKFHILSSANALNLVESIISLLFKELKNTKFLRVSLFCSSRSSWELDLRKRLGFFFS